MKILFYIVMISVFMVFLFCFINSPKETPKLYKQLNIDILKKYNFEYFKKNHNIDIYVSRSRNNSIDMSGNIKKMKLSDYCNTIMKKDPNWYFRTEDEYDFLNMIGIKQDITRAFDSIFDKKNNKNKKDCSFWMGGKGSVTGWHTDIDDLSYLYVMQGKKQVKLASPSENKNMYIKKIFMYGSKWSEIDCKNINYKKYPKFKNVKITSYILNEGDCLFIPKNWWHCVENLEDTIGVTYKIYRPKQYSKTMIKENIREKYCKFKQYEIYDIKHILKIFEN